MTLVPSASRTLFQSVVSAHTACCVGIGAVLLTSCSSPPKPPSVDESTRRPVNVRAAIDLKACQGDLSRAALLVSEMARAGVVPTSLNKPLPVPDAVLTGASDSKTTSASGNLVAVVPFGMGSAAWNLEKTDAAALVRRARDAAVIMIRGRTDATADSLQETALAHRRAEAAADFLRLAGVPGDKLRLTWQGAGDPVAGLRTTERGQSRRVEIEFYAAAPVFVSLRNGSTGNANVSTGSRSAGLAPAPDRTKPDAASSL